MKYEWRKEEKLSYFPKKISIQKIPKYSFLILEGEGNPNSLDFSQRIEALYSISYGIRMYLKKGVSSESFEYTVYPLEGVWTTKDGSKDESLNKEMLLYRIMIRQPELVTEKILQEVIETTKKKKNNPYINKLKFERYEEGKVLQKIHVGSFETENQTFYEMDQFLEETNYERDWIMESFVHREIYLSDFRRVAPERRKTLLRYQLKEKKV